MAASFVALVVVAGAVALLLLATTGGGGAASDGTLSWREQPRVIQTPGNARERILTGSVRNRSATQVEVEAARIKVVDARGRRLPTSAIFLSSFVRGIYSGSRLGQGSDFERRRTGKLARLEPGGSRPLTVAWRDERGRGSAARVEYPGGSLPIPR